MKTSFITYVPELVLSLIVLASVSGCGNQVAAQWKNSPDIRFKAFVICPTYEGKGPPWIDVRLEDATTGAIIHSARIQFKAHSPNILLRGLTDAIMWAPDSTSFSILTADGEKVLELATPK